MASHLTEYDELDELNGYPLAAFGYDDVEQEWIFIFTNGRRLILSAGDEPEFSLSTVLQ